MSAHVDDLCAFSSSVQLTQETLADEDKPVQTKPTGTIIISTKGNLESHLVNGLFVIGFVKTHALEAKTLGLGHGGVLPRGGDQLLPPLRR